MRNWEQLSVHERINVKQYAIKVYGKQWHTPNPNFCGRLDEIQLHSILSGFYF